MWMDACFDVWIDHHRSAKENINKMSAFLKEIFND
jgi:hypothetical protein